MATLTISGFSGTSDLQQAAAGDALTGSTIKSHASTALTLNASATNVLLQVANVSYLSISSAAVAVANGAKFSGDGSLLTNLPTTAVAGGGTGQTTLAAHGVLIGGATSPVSITAPGAVGQLLTSQGASADPAMMDPITATNGSTTLGSTYTISVDNGSFESTGLNVTLPSAGTYLVWYQVRSNVVAVTTAGAFIATEMYNATDSLAIANSEQIGAYASTTGASYYGRAFVQMIVTVAGPKSLYVYAKTTAPGTTSTRTINSDANGRSRIGYVKVGN